MLRIHEILVRIQIRGSISLIADPDPAIFVSDLQDVNKIFFFSRYFRLLPFEGTVTLFFKDRKS